MQGLGHRIGRSPCQHRHGKQAGADNAAGKQQEGQHTGNRTQRLGGLRGGIDGDNTLTVQRGGSGENNGKGDDIGKHHADAGVPFDAVDMAVLVKRRVAQSGSAMELQFLHLLSRLPDEHIGTDGGAEHRHHGQRIIAGPADRRHHQRAAHFQPRHVDGQHRDDIDKQHHGEPFQRTGVAAIGNGDLEHDAKQAEGDGHHFGKQLRPAHHQPQGFSHGGKIGGNVDDVGKQHQHDNADNQRGRTAPRRCRHQTLAAGAADAGCNHLDGDHEGQCHNHGPQLVEAELGAGLRIGGNAGGVIIGGPRNDPGAQQTPERMAGMMVVAGRMDRPRHGTL